MKQENFKHISFDQRCVIYKMIVNNYMLKEIGTNFNIKMKNINKHIESRNIYNIQY